MVVILTALTYDSYFFGLGHLVGIQPVGCWFSCWIGNRSNTPLHMPPTYVVAAIRDLRLSPSIPAVFFGTSE